MPWRQISTVAYSVQVLSLGDVSRCLAFSPSCFHWLQVLPLTKPKPECEDGVVIKLSDYHEPQEADDGSLPGKTWPGHTQRASRPPHRRHARKGPANLIEEVRRCSAARREQST
jgi:hypothetical protein